MSKKKTVTIEGSVYISLESWNKGEVGFIAVNFNSDSWERQWKHEMYKIAPYTIEIEMPDGIDLHKVQLDALQHKRKLILAENQKNLNAVDEEISNLMALENKG